jgi:hypothetical protein
MGMTSDFKLTNTSQNPGEFEDLGVQLQFQEDNNSQSGQQRKSEADCVNQSDGAMNIEDKSGMTA